MSLLFKGFSEADRRVLIHMRKDSKAGFLISVVCLIIAVGALVISIISVID